MLQLPLPAIHELTSSAIHVLAAMEPDEAMRLPSAGALSKVSLSSSQVLSATRFTSTPALVLLFRYRRRVARDGVPVRPWTLKRRYDRTMGNPSVRKRLAA